MRGARKGLAARLKECSPLSIYVHCHGHRLNLALQDTMTTIEPKTYNDSNSLLNSICDFRFVFGLMVLKVILSNTDGLSRYLQGKQMNVVTAKRSVDGVIKTLSGCRTQENFDLFWSRAEIMAGEIKELIEGTDFNFKDAKVPMLRQPSRRLQALVGEMSELNAEVAYRTAAEDHCRITCYYLSIDKIVTELKCRFESHDQEVLLALADVVFSSSPTTANIELVSYFYGIDSELLSSEKNVFENIDADYPDSERKNAATMVRRMFEKVL